MPCCMRNSLLLFTCTSSCQVQEKPQQNGDCSRWLVTPGRQQETTANQTHQLSSLQVHEPKSQRGRRDTPARKATTQQQRAHRMGTFTL